MEGEPEVEPRTVMILVEWASRDSFRAFLDDPELVDLHPLREDGTRNYLWWTYESLDDLRPLFANRGS
jgi:heme-degrading monooxygenase HmoA